MELKEGQVDTYKAISIKRIDESEDEFFVLQHPNGGKFLLPYQPYKDYCIQVGASITCRIDKINCSGKIYVEPVHPIYKEEEEYLFKVISANQTSLPTGDFMDILVVDDCYGNKIDVFVSNIDPDIKTITCKVDYIRKGKLILSTQVRRNTHTTNLIVGESYPFTIIAKIRHENSLNYVLEAPDKSKHIIDSIYYKKYGLEVGKTYTGTISKLSKKGFYLIEPNHPFYEIGKMYSFEVAEIVSFVRDEDFKQICKVIVLDIFAEKSSIDWSMNEKLPSIGSFISCTIIGFRRGKVLLEKKKVDF